MQIIHWLPQSFCQETGHLHSTDGHVENGWKINANCHVSAKHNHVPFFDN